jgi:L-ascorbate metabolism protein UlaG (beta-lactamase superfamily)
MGRGHAFGQKRVMKRIIFIATAAATFLVLFFAVRALQAPVRSEPTLCHLFNEAFAISDGRTTVLTDAFAREGFPEDQMAPPAMLSALEGAAAPYQKATLITVSHKHIDHFSAPSLLARLESDPGVHILLTKEAEGELLANGGEPYRDRIHGLTPARGTPEKVTINGIEVEVFNLDHRVEVENNGYLFTVGGKTFFHMGDISSADFTANGLDGISVDYLLIPYWYYLDPADREDFLTKIDAKYIVPMHMPKRDADLKFLAKLGGWEAAMGSIKALSPKILFLFEPGACVAPAEND